MDNGADRRSGLASGWILVTGLLLLCVTGTGLTWWNYSRQVFSSAQGVVFASAGSDGVESRISVRFPPGQARVIRIGHGAIITAGTDSHPLKGRVVSVAYGQAGAGAKVILRLVDDPSPVTGTPMIVKGGGQFLHPHLLTGTTCSVTIDTTIPPGDGGGSSRAPVP